jgi:MraZ protein
VPTVFRRHLEQRYGRDVFLTSVLGDSVMIYPLPVWEEIEDRLAALPSTDRTKQRYLERVSYYGQQARLDGQGRVVIPPLLRDSAEMAGEVVVSARLDHLEVWNRKRLQTRFTEQPFSEDDFSYLSEKGI